MSRPDVLTAVLEHARTRPDHPAVKGLDRELSYAQLRDEARHLAGAMSALGVGVGDRVGLDFPNSVDWVVTALAGLWTGAVFVPLAIGDPPVRLATILDDCAPSLVVTSDRAAGAPRRPASLGHWPWIEFSRLRSTGRPDAVADPTPGPVAYTIYTSGTTGSPKGVVIGWSAFVAAVEATSAALGLDAGTRTLCVSPFHFDGSFGTLFPTLVAGGTVVIRPREALLFPRTFFKSVAQESITYTGFSPSYLRLLLQSPQLATLEESSLECIALGGEASSFGDVRALWTAAPSVRVFNRYGPTETTIAVTHVHLTPDRTAEGTVPIGTPHPGVTFHLLDRHGRAVRGAGRVGELYIGGRQLMDGYWRAPELTASVLRTDLVPGTTVYRTGDLVYRNHAGDFVYVDRADRVIKRNGVRISLVELGEAMRALPGVSAAACVVFDNDGETGIAAFVVTNGTVTPIDLRRDARIRLPDTMLPDCFEIVRVLPLTGSSKVDEHRLLEGAGLVAWGATRAPGDSSTAVGSRAVALGGR